MTGQFEQLTINNELTPEETAAIDALDPATDVLKISSLKTALASEVIKGTNENFLSMADEFVKYVSYTKETNNGIEVIPAGLTCDEKAPNRLKILIKKPEENDFAYFLYKVSGFLNVTPVANLEAKKIGEKTKTQLEALKKVIPPPDKTANAPTATPTANAPTAITTVNAPTANPTVNVVPTTTETLKSEEIKITLYKVTPDQVVKAIDTLKKSNPTLANTIIPLLKSGTAKEVQEKLGMTDDAKFLYKKADGIFGPMSLKNLEAGTVVKYTGTGNINTWTLPWTTNINIWTDKKTNKVRNKETINKGKTTENIEEVNIINLIKEARTLYKTDETKAINELETYLEKNSSDLSEDPEYHHALAVAILNNEESFPFWYDTLYIMITTTWLEIFDSKSKFTARKETIKKEEIEKGRKEKASIYSDKIFPNSLIIYKTGDKFYIKNNVRIPLANYFLSSISTLPFSSRENAQEFIDTSKNYIEEYWYWVKKDSSDYNLWKIEYLNKIKDLFTTVQHNEWFWWAIKQKIEEILSSAIDNLKCRL